MTIPDFLKREHPNPFTEKEEYFCELVERYKEMYGEEPMTEPLGFLPMDELCELIEKCLSEKKSYEELTGDIHDPDALY